MYSEASTNFRMPKRKSKTSKMGKISTTRKHAFFQVEEAAAVVQLCLFHFKVKMHEVQVKMHELQVKLTP